jgi:adenylate cyclase
MSKNRKPGTMRISLSFKFTFFVALLLTAIMIAMTVFIYNQEKNALTSEVKKRGTAIAKNLANNAAEALTTNEELTLFVLAKQAVQDPMKDESISENFWNSVFLNVVNDVLGKTEAEKVIKNDGILDAVVLRKGIIVSASDVKKKDMVYKVPDGIRPLNGREDVLIQEYTEEGKNYFDIAVPIIVAGDKSIGEVHLKVSQAIITKVVTNATVKIILITLAALLIGIIVTIILVSLMMDPVRHLVKGVRLMGDGNFDVQIKLKSSDELGELTDAFNATAKSLKEKELLKGAFSTYVSGALMEEILKDPAKLSLHGKKLMATMLFTDIRGFTSMSETLDPVEVVSIINEYLTLQTDKVIKWSGVLDKFIGDCVMAVYGVPFAKDDDAYRAVRTAMDIREGLLKLNVIRERKGARTVGIGIGINTGEVVSGNMGSPQKMDYTVIGDNVNLASRLEANAPAGMIFVSESTYLETREKIEYRQLESIMVKGKKEPVKIYEPVSIIS